MNSFKQQCENLRFINETMREKIAKKKEKLERNRSYDQEPHHVRERLGEKQDRSLPAVPEFRLFRKRRSSGSQRFRAKSAKRRIHRKRNSKA